MQDSTAVETEKRFCLGKERPPVFPNGWIPVAESWQVSANNLFKSNLFTHELVLFREKDGKVRVLDAYCPHLGAHFAYGGKVVQEDGKSCVRCPFHGWIFRGQDGLCTRVPYAENERPPNGVKVKSWEALEVNGFISIWYHAEGMN